MEMHRKKMSLFNVHVYFWFCLQFIVTDQRDFLERSSMFCDMVQQDNIENEPFLIKETPDD